MAEYKPIQTKADRQAALPGNVFEKVKDIVGALYPEHGSTASRKFDQGRDELANVLFSGNAYLPWPGQGQEPQVASVDPQDLGQIRPLDTEPKAPSIGDHNSLYTTHSTPSHRPSHNSMYTSHEDELKSAYKQGRGMEKGQERDR